MLSALETDRFCETEMALAKRHLQAADAAQARGERNVAEFYIDLAYTVLSSHHEMSKSYVQ
jgi:hypothetical protein